jgi:hypothetical protein
MLHVLLTRAATVATLAMLAASAGAQSTFRIESLYSSLDGSTQFIRLKETAGLDGQHRFAGLKITSTRRDVVKEFTFAADLPTEKTAYASLLVAVGWNIFGGVAEDGGMSFWWAADGGYELPTRFLPADGGVVDFADIDHVSYAALPTDGILGVLRDGTIAAVTIPRVNCVLCDPSQRRWQEGSMEETLVTAYEYYNERLDHYFLTASAPDIDALDSGRQPGWKRTGESFYVGAHSLVATYCDSGWWYGCGEKVPTQPVCRFYVPPEYGDTHYLSASASECAMLRERFPVFFPETDAAFFVVLPDPAGECPDTRTPPRLTPAPLVPVFRLFSGRRDTNHRFTYELSIRNAMIAQGWIPEGAGPQGVAFCIPYPFG